MSNVSSDWIPHGANEIVGPHHPIYVGTEPPLGLRPRWIVLLNRLTEIRDAQARFRAGGSIPPLEWAEESDEITVWLSQNHPQSLREMQH